MGEDLECLCQIMRTVGPRLDHEKAKVTVQSDQKMRVSEVSSSPQQSLSSPCLSVFNGSVLWPYAILNESQGVARQDPLPAARHSGAARKQLGPPQGFH